MEKLKNQLPNIIFLSMLTLIVGYITYNRFLIQMDIGPVWDTYDLLADAALFAGQNIGYMDIVRPPVMPFLTSIFFRFTGLVEWPIFAIDSLIFIFGCIGLYIFFKLRFDGLTSFLGVLLFSTFPPILAFVSAGLTDLPSVCISIWALLFTVLAVKKDSRLFYISFPLAMIAFLTRFTSALLIFPILFYILVNWDEIKNRKNILIGILLSFLVLIPVLWLFNTYLGNPFYTFMDFFGSSSSSVSESAGNNLSFAYNPDFFYFIKNIPTLIGSEGFGVILVILLGFSISIFKRFNKKRSQNIPQSSLKNSIKVFREEYVDTKLLFLIFLSVLFIFTIRTIHYILSVFIFFILIYFIYNYIKNFEYKNKDIDFLFLLWFMTFFIFHSVYVIKEYRYFITMAPTVAYFLMLGFNLTTSKFGFRIKNKNITQYIFGIFLILLIISSALSYLPYVTTANDDLKLLNKDINSSSNWLIETDPDYKNKVIYSDFWPYSGWFLQRNVSKMPIFRNNQVIYTGSKDLNFTDQDRFEYNRELNSHNADYYFSIRKGLNFTNYKPVKQFGSVILYKKYY